MGKLPLWAAVDLSGVTPSNTTDVTEVTTAGYYNNTYVDRAIRLGGATTVYFEIGPWTAETEFYLGFGFRWQGTITHFDNQPIIFYNNSGTAVFRWSSADGVIQNQYWNGAAWTNIGSTWTPTINTLYRVDIKIDITNDQFDMRVGGTSVASGSVDLASLTNIEKVRFFQSSALVGSSQPYYSAIIADDADTLDRWTMKGTLNGAGATNNFSNSYASIDESGIDDSDLVGSSVAGDISTYVFADFTVPSGHAVEAFCLTARARNTGAAPDNLKVAYRVSSTDYESGAYANITTSYRGLFTGLAQNPNTTTDWTQTSVNAAEIGFESAT